MKRLNKKKAKPQTDTFRMLSDRQHVRLRKGMYIPNKGYTIFELIDNGMDEYARGYGNELELTINESGEVTVKDYGRGLPIEESIDVPGKTIAELCMSRLKAGTKFGDEGKTGGLNGVGASAINFLCEYFNVSIRKDGKEYSMKFEKGELTAPLQLIGDTKEPNGTTIICLPDPEMWEGFDDYNINEINNRTKQLCYLNPGVNIKVNIDYANNNIHETYCYPEGVKTYIDELTKNTEPIHDAWSFSKSIAIGDENKTVDMDISFVYTESYSDTVYAFTNNVANTDSKSSNITGFKRGIAAAMKECYEAEYPKSKINLTAKDTHEGLIAIVSIKVDNPNYIGQGKDYLNMPAIASAIYGEVKEFCEDQLDKFPNDKDNILNRIVEANKVREAASKAKEAARKTKGIAGGKVEGLTKCLSKKPSEKYIWLVEGKKSCLR